MPAGTTVTPVTPGQLTKARETKPEALPPAEPPRTAESAAANSVRPVTLAEVVAIRSKYDNPVRLGMADLAKEGKEQTIGGVTVTFSETGPSGKAPDGFVFAHFKGKGADGKAAEASVLVHKASGDLAKLNKEGASVSISAFEQTALNPFFSQMREGLKELGAQRANQRATKVSEGLQPVKDGKAPHLAELAKEVGAQGGSVTTGRVTVRSEGPSKEGAKGAPAKPEAVPADHHRLTIELQPISQAGSTPGTPRVLSLVVDDKTGTVGASTIGGKTATEQEVNAFLVEAQGAAKPAPTAKSQQGTDTPQGGVPASTRPQLSLDKFLSAYGKVAKDWAGRGPYTKDLEGGEIQSSTTGPNGQQAEPGRWFLSFKKPSGDSMVAYIDEAGGVTKIWQNGKPIAVDTKSLYSFAQAVWHPKEQK